MDIDGSQLRRNFSAAEGIRNKYKDAKGQGCMGSPQVPLDTKHNLFKCNSVENRRKIQRYKLAVMETI